MNRPKLEDTKTPKGHQSIGGNSVNVYQYSKLQDEYIDYLEQKVKKCSIPDVGRSEQLKKFLHYVANASDYANRNKMNLEAEQLLNKLF